MIRPANFDTDALAIVNGAREFADSTSLKSWFRLGDDFVSDIAKVITLGNIEVLVAEHNGKIVGGLGIAYVPFIWNQTILIGDELFWWVEHGAPFRTGSELFHHAIAQIKNKGAIPMFRSLDTSPPRIDKFYERHGLKKFESVFTGVS